jgi:hypothetical protein
MRDDYPKDYKGPKAGVSFNQEWLEVTEYQAFKYMVFGIWKFSDFDCWLGAMMCKKPLKKCRRLLKYDHERNLRSRIQ